jgi:hypothetical protein
LQEKLSSAIGMMEQWNDGIMGSGLRLGENIVRVGLENQNEYNCIDFLVRLAYFLGRKQKMDVGYR